MTDEDFLRRSFVALEVNGDFTEAVVGLSDESRLCFCHRVGERTATAMGSGDITFAAQVLPRIAMFRLNTKHLDIQFADGSRWEALLR